VLVAALTTVSCVVIFVAGRLGTKAT
jgi:hypothetical protein